MWHILWNIMAVVGILTVITCIMIFIAFLMNEVPERRKKAYLNNYLNRKDDA